MAFSKLNLRCADCDRSWVEEIRVPIKITPLAVRLGAIMCACGAKPHRIHVAMKRGDGGGGHMSIAHATAQRARIDDFQTMQQAA